MYRIACDEANGFPGNLGIQNNWGHGDTGKIYIIVVDSLYCLFELCYSMCVFYVYKIIGVMVTQVKYI